MADVSTLNRVRYAGLDFDTIEDELRARLQVKFASTFNDFSVSSLGVVLMDIVSFGLDTLSFYLDRRATDTYLSTARTRRSVSALSRQLGYKMHGAVASSVDLTVSVKTLFAFPIPIPKGFQFQGPGGSIFEAAQAVTIPASSLLAVSIPTYQAQTVTETFVSNGTANQVFKLSRVPDKHAVVQGTVQINVNGTAYVESEFITFDATDQFEVAYNDEPPSIRFGDGVAGNIPIKDGSISVTYSATLGEAGQSLSGTITAPVTPLVVSFTQIPLNITNAQSTIGGSDPESLDHAKAFAPRVFKSRRVAVTRGDYEALAGSFVDPLFGRVAVAQAISARTAADDIELQNLVDVIANSSTDAANAIEASLTTVSTGAYAYWSDVNLSATQLQTDVTMIATRLTTVNTNLGTLTASARTIKTNSSEAQSNYGDANTVVTTAKTNVTTLRDAVNLLPTGASQLTAPDKVTYLALLDGFTTSFNKVSSLLNIMNGLLASIGSAADSQTTLTQIVQSALVDEVGISVLTANTNLKSLQTEITAQVAALGNAVGLPAAYTALYLQLYNIESAKTVNKATIDAAAADIETHVDGILAADCQANLVVVPILARDASGFYAAPSTGLVRSLQAYLDGIKEVTQSVRVTSGSGFLIPAAIRVRISIRVGISDQVVQASARTVIDGILRDRSFGKALYLSDLVEPLSLLNGVVFVNAAILGYVPPGSVSVDTGKNDADGNLVIEDSEVITLSASNLTISVETFTASS